MVNLKIGSGVTSLAMADSKDLLVVGAVTLTHRFGCFDNNSSIG